MKSRSPFVLVSVAALCLLDPRSVSAQTGSTRLPVAIPVGSDLEAYLRVLQLVDSTVTLYPWSVRDFSHREIARVTPAADSRPFGARFHAGRAPGNAGGATLEQMSSRAELWYNSSFPFGMNDGPVWRGRGLTAVAQAGAALTYGSVSLVLSPLAFYAENRSFTLMPSAQTGPNVYSDPWRPYTIDRPQRFGEEAYTAIDPGASTLRIDAGPVTLGASTANMWWGPMMEYPYVLGNNAAGFAHVFMGSATPLNIGVGEIHGRLIYGNLDQSAFAIDTGLAARRFASGIVGVFKPRGILGLELGGARFFHTPARQGGPTWRDFRLPIEAFLKENVSVIPGEGSDRDNQLASIFFRWVLPRSGLEVYGEYGREDHSGDERDLLQEPDHSATYGLGFLRAWQRTRDVITLRGEAMSIDPSLLGVHRPEGAIYAHTYLRQGHTQRGQLLGAGFGSFWGSASTLSLERFNGDGRSALTLTRAVVRERGGESGIASPTVADEDVQYALTARTSRRRGSIELVWEVTGVYELNRNLAGDARALNGGVSVNWW